MTPKTIVTQSGTNFDLLGFKYTKPLIFWKGVTPYVDTNRGLAALRPHVYEARWQRFPKSSQVPLMGC